MRARPAGSPVRPRTLVGKWLTAALLEQHELRDQLVAQFPRGPLTDDNQALITTICELAVRAYFGTGYDAHAVPEFAAGVHDRQDGNFSAGPAEVAAVVRAALGETDAGLSEIPPAKAITARILAVTHAFQLLEWDEPAVNYHVAEAEAIVFRQGWQPQLAT